MLGYLEERFQWIETGVDCESLRLNILTPIIIFKTRMNISQFDIFTVTIEIKMLSTKISDRVLKPKCNAVDKCYVL